MKGLFNRHFQSLFNRKTNQLRKGVGFKSQIRSDREPVILRTLHLTLVDVHVLYAKRKREKKERELLFSFF